jgi:hypothetical protein
MASSSKGGKESISLIRKKKRPSKHPIAPKKPCSAFIHFSQQMHREKKLPHKCNENLKEKVK